MKRKDIILILVVVFASAVVALVISKIFINSPKSRTTKVEVVEQISSDFKQPDKRFFNADAIDPTLNIQIGENPNPTPFNGSN